jgi:hypothetical protein
VTEVRDPIAITAESVQVIIAAVGALFGAYSVIMVSMTFSECKYPPILLFFFSIVPQDTDLD